MSVANYSGRVEGGPLDGGVLTGTAVYEWDKINAIGLSGNGVGRKACATLVWQLGQFMYILTMVDGNVHQFGGDRTGERGVYRDFTPKRRLERGPFIVKTARRVQCWQSRNSNR